VSRGFLVAPLDKVTRQDDKVGLGSQDQVHALPDKALGNKRSGMDICDVPYLQAVKHGGQALQPDFKPRELQSRAVDEALSALTPISQESIA